MIVAGIVLVIIAIMMIFSCGYSIPDEVEADTLTKPFYRIGAMIYEKLIERENSAYYKRMFEKMRLLYPQRSARDELRTYMISKLGMMMVLLFAGFFIVGVVAYKESQASVFSDENVIQREASDGEQYLVMLDANLENMPEGYDSKIENLEITINEKKYTEKEFRDILPKFYEELESIILGENESLDYVNKDLNLVTKIDSYPFRIEWATENISIMKSSGVLGNDIPKEGVINTLTARVTYEDYNESYLFSVYVFPREMTYLEMITEKINQLIEKEDYETREEDFFVLPEAVDGIRITWKEEKKRNALILGIVIVTALIGIFAGKDVDVAKRIEERQNQMLSDYPEIISKLTLFIGAGMTIKGAWKKICNEYKQRKKKEIRYAYEEMLITAYEMDSGISEYQCYQRFSDRVRLQKYVKLMSLISQNLKMGSKTFVREMVAESKDALEERKHAVERQGEVAGTKLMLPMFMMLGIVIVVIMVPAFMTM